MLRPSSSLVLFPLLALGIHLGSRSPFRLSTLLLPFCILLVSWLFLAYRGRSPGGWLFGVILIFGTLLVGYLSALPEQAWAVPESGDFVGRVYHVRTLSYDQRVLVRLDPSQRQVAVHLPLEADLQIGDELFFSGTISRPRQAPNPGVFCYRQYLRHLAVFGVCYPDIYEVRKGAPTLLTTVRLVLRNNIVAHVQDPGLVLALVLGERDQLGNERQDIWRQLGISHLLAISGMHVGFVALGLGLIVKRLPLRPLARLLVIQGALLAYIIVAGSGASAWRALLLGMFGGYATFRGLRQDSLHLWATVGWLLLLVKPTLAFDTGFTLSFAASGGIILWSPSLRAEYWLGNPVLRYVADSLIISIIAQLSLAPFLFGYFGEIAILGPLATLLFLPAVLILMIGGFLVSLGLGPLGLGQGLDTVIHVVNSLESLLLPWARQWRLGAWTEAEIYLCWLVFVYAGWRLRKPRLTKPRRTMGQLVTIVIVLVSVLCLPPALRRPLEVTAVNVGQGDCFFVKTPGGIQLLIDGGGDSLYWQERGRNVGVERLVPYLQHRQVSRLDYVILSHPHEDHLFGLLAALEHFEVGMMIDNGQGHNGPTYERYLQLLEEKNIEYHVARAGDSLRLGDGITLDVLYPETLREHLPSAYNNNSLLLRLEYGGVRLLFTGDLERAVLYDLAHDVSCDLQADWLKVPHHGSRGSLLPRFYERVNPRWALISVGPNSFGHPHQEVLDLLDQANITWRTTQDGPQTFHVWWGLWGRFISPSS